MLTKEQRKLISKTASEKHHLDISTSQIAHLVLDKFECNFYFQDKYNYITGKVKNFHKFPLRMDFNAPEGSPGREALLSGLQQNINIKNNLHNHKLPKDILQMFEASLFIFILIS